MMAIDGSRIGTRIIFYFDESIYQPLQEEKLT